MENNYIYIGKLNKEQLGKYKKKLLTRDVILTYERLHHHILVYHQQEYIQIQEYVREIIENPDIIIEDNTHKDTLIFLKHIQPINKKARIVVRLVTTKENKCYTKNSIITIMRQRNKSWNQTIKNRGTIIFTKLLDKSE